MISMSFLMNFICMEYYDFLNIFHQLKYHFVTNKVSLEYFGMLGLFWEYSIFQGGSGETPEVLVCQLSM